MPEEIREWFEVQYWAPDPSMPGVQVPGNGVWTTAVTDIYDRDVCMKMVADLQQTYVRVRTLHHTHSAIVIGDNE